MRPTVTPGDDVVTPSDDVVAAPRTVMRRRGLSFNEVPVNEALNHVARHVTLLDVTT